MSQTTPIEKDTIAEKYLIIEGDTTLSKTIKLNEVLVMPRLVFKNRDERIDYLILRRKTLKVYPYAKMAAERLVELNKELEQFKKKRKKKRHAKKVQKFIEKEFSEELKKLTKTEGQILVKLIF